MGAAVSATVECEVRFGGWYDGDNHKTGRGWYFVCGGCRAIGLGQLLPESARRDFAKHARRCPSAAVGSSKGQAA
jgi:hypothetical protein